jgi:hypothetical protein
MFKGKAVIVDSEKIVKDGVAGSRLHFVMLIERKFKVIAEGIVVIEGPAVCKADLF